MRSLITSDPWAESLQRFISTWIIGLAILAVVILLGPLGPAIETRYKPVVVDGAWGEIVREVPGGIVVSGTATKQRSCGWKETRFFLGTRGNLYANIGEGSGQSSPARHLGPPQVRGEGDLVWEEIFLPVTRSQFERGLVFADAFHKCSDDLQHLTRSRLFN